MKSSSDSGRSLEGESQQPALLRQLGAHGGRGYDGFAGVAALLVFGAL